MVIFSISIHYFSFVKKKMFFSSFFFQNYPTYGMDCMIIVLHQHWNLSTPLLIFVMLILREHNKWCWLTPVTPSTKLFVLVLTSILKIMMCNWNFTFSRKWDVNSDAIKFEHKHKSKYNSIMLNILSVCFSVFCGVLPVYIITILSVSFRILEHFPPRLHV